MNSARYNMDDLIEAQFQAELSRDYEPMKKILSEVIAKSKV